MAGIVERFGLSQDVIMGVQAIPPASLDTPIIIPNVTITVDVIGAFNTSNGVLIPVPGSVLPSDGVTTRVMIYNASLTAGSIGTDLTAWSLKRTNSAGVVVVASGSTGPITAPFLLSAGTHSQEWDNVDDETITLGVAGDDATTATFTLVTSSYIITWAPAIDVTGIKILKNNLEGERIALVDLTFAGQVFQLRLVFRDETLMARTLTGQAKQRTS